MSAKYSKNGASGARLWARILALILCVLMLGGTAIVLIQYLALGSYALEGFSANQKVRVGIMYGSGVTTGYEVKSDTGFNLGYTSEGSGGSFTSIWQLSETAVTVASDANLAKSGRTYWVTGSYNSTFVGAYHVEVDIGTAADFAARYAGVEAAALTLTDEIFPAMVGGAYVLRIGNFATRDDAELYLLSVQQVLPGAYVVSPSGRGISVMEPDSGKILFEFDDGSGRTSLCMLPRGDGSGRNVLVSGSSRQYEGIFEFSRYISGARDGVQVVNILSMDEYINGLLPWEISSSWPLESLKAMAVASRTYSLSMLNRHSEYGFDMCSGTHCQAYLGIGRANDATRRAVRETSGVVLTYNNAPARTYYSAVMGECTVKSSDAWGGYDLPYLHAMWTPWEKYSEHPEGDWQTEVTPQQLANTLNNHGYSEITAPIVDISIDQLCQNSTYIYQITFTDENGGTATITTSDRIRTVLQSHVNSANFVVVRGGETAILTDTYPSGGYPWATASPTSVSYGTQTQQQEIIAAAADGDHSVATDVIYISGGDQNGVIASDALNQVAIASADGTVYANLGGSVQTSSQVAVDNGAYIASLADMTVYRVDREVEAEGDPENFVFVGRGWGHGVGMSQFGAMNMADMGYNYSTILMTYYPGTKITVLS